MGRDEPRLEDLEPDTAEVVNRFVFHPAAGVTGVLHENVRFRHRELALWILTAVPDCRERSLALTALQESMMWCNAAIAYRTEQP
jgi:hypothetical protein